MNKRKRICLVLLKALDGKYTDQAEKRLQAYTDAISQCEALRNQLIKKQKVRQLLKEVWVL